MFTDVGSAFWSIVSWFIRTTTRREIDGRASRASRFIAWLLVDGDMMTAGDNVVTVVTIEVIAWLIVLSYCRSSKQCESEFTEHFKIILFFNSVGSIAKIYIRFNGKIFNFNE